MSRKIVYLLLAAFMLLAVCGSAWGHDGSIYNPREQPKDDDHPWGGDNYGDNGTIGDEPKIDIISSNPSPFIFYGIRGLYSIIVRVFETPSTPVTIPDTTVNNQETTPTVISTTSSSMRAE